MHKYTTLILGVGGAKWTFIMELNLSESKKNWSESKKVNFALERKFRLDTGNDILPISRIIKDIELCVGFGERFGKD